MAEDSIGNVLMELGLEKDAAQRVITNGDEFTRALREVARASMQELARTAQFGYPAEHKPVDIEDQIKILKAVFPHLGTADVSRAEGRLPARAEGWFAIPRWETIAASYDQATDRVLHVLREAREDNFFKYLDGREILRPTSTKKAKFREIEREQGGHDILVVAAQFGLRHHGRSVRRANEVMPTNEFGLGAYECAVMLLTHPNRMVRQDHLNLDCPGDYFSHPEFGSGQSPEFQVGEDGALLFGGGSRTGKNPRSGVVSAFL